MSASWSIVLELKIQRKKQILNKGKITNYDRHFEEKYRVIRMTWTLFVY